MVYVGSNRIGFISILSLSSLALQQAIQSYGLSKFTVVVFEVVELPTGLSYQSRKLHLVEREKSKFPSAQLYNIAYSSS